MKNELTSFTLLLIVEIAKTSNKWHTIVQFIFTMEHFQSRVIMGENKQTLKQEDKMLISIFILGILV